MDKTIRLGTITPQRIDIFCKIAYRGGRLSISGVEGPLANGNARGSCGQIIMGFKEYDQRGYQSINDIDLAPEWTRPMIIRFFDTWDRWHLNDMRAGTVSQTEYLRRIGGEYPGYPLSYYEWASERLALVGLNPDGGYSYGHAWLRESVPDEVIDFLGSLPYSDKTPSWV